MSANLEIVYLDHSGFAVKTAQHLLVFDYYRDPAKVLPALLQEGKTTWVFASHSHGDHFNPVIGEWKDNVAGYYLSDDIVAEGGLAGVDPENIVYMGPYKTKVNNSLWVSTYGSTDQGVSFLVDVDGWRLFHAGDLNWWHWKGDTADDQRMAETMFRKELDQLAGLKLDAAFFPVDSRLEEYRAVGVEEFCRRVEVRQLVAMHDCGQPWTPPKQFINEHKTMAVWCPAAAGERLQFSF